MPEPDFRALGLAVARARASRGWSIDKLAGVSGLARRSVINLENGHHEPTLRNLHAVAHALGVPLAELVAAVCSSESDK